MAKVQVTKAWTISPNVRMTPYVSLPLTVGWYVYQNTVAMLAAGWTCKFSSTGIVGPSSAADTTNRITADTAFVTRATVAAAVQSWIVMQNADGVQVLFAYQGASDNILRISMSQGGLFTLAGTTTHQPTATDEVIALQATSVVGTATAARVMSIGCTTEQWWCACFSVGAITMFASIEKVDSACDTVVFAKPYVMLSCTNLTNDAGGTNFAPSGTSVTSHHDGHSPAGSSAYRGPTTRVVTSGTSRIIRVGGGVRSAPCGPVTYASCYGTGGYGALSFANNGHTLTTPPALNNGTVPVLTIDWFGEKTAGMDGYLGSPIDFWYAHSSSQALPATGDMIAALGVGDTQAAALRTNWLVAIGSGIIRPWLNAAASMQTF